MIARIRSLQTLELLGGSPCLDFANTINSRRQLEHDYLPDYADLAGWAVKAGLLSSAQCRRLQARAAAQPAPARRAWRKALSLRDLLYRLFSSLAKGAQPAPQDRRLLLQQYAEAVAHSAFLKSGDQFTLTWDMEAELDALLWPVIYSAGQLLLSAQLARVKECPNCGWLFLDTSKNQNRRWCSMNTCGARDKMRRYHRKLRL